MLTMLLGIFTLLIVFYIIMLVHETGHLLAARAVGIEVEEFLLGFPAAKRGFYIGDLHIRLGVPLAAGLNINELRLYRQPKWKRVVMLAGGPLASLILLVLVFGIVKGPAKLPVLIEVTASTAGIFFQTGLEDLFPREPFLSDMAIEAGELSLLQGLLTAVGLYTILYSIITFLFNLLPIPGLDGGRIVLTIIEKFVGIRIQRTSERLNKYSTYGLLGILMIIILWQVALEIGLF